MLRCCGFAVDFDVMISIFLRECFVMDEKEYQKYCVGRRKCNTRNDINGFSDSNWMWRLFFPNLNKTSLIDRKTKSIEKYCHQTMKIIIEHVHLFELIANLHKIEIMKN